MRESEPVTMKRGKIIFLWGLGLALVLSALPYVGFGIWYGLECVLPIKHHEQTLDAGAGRTIELFSDVQDIEFSALLLRGCEKGEVVVPMTRLSGLAMFYPEWRLVAATNIPLVGLVTQNMGSTILAMVNFQTREVWRGVSSSDVERSKGARMLEELKKGTGKRDLVLEEEG